MEKSHNRLNELHEKIEAGCNIAFQKMPDYKRHNGGYIVFYEWKDHESKSNRV